MRLNHVTLVVTELRASMRFYEKLGLTAIVLDAPRYARFTLPSGDETLSLEVTGEAATGSRVQLYLECPDLDRVVDELKQRGLRFEQGPDDMDYLWREARLRDPDGHQIRLYFAGDNRLRPPWRLGRAHAAAPAPRGAWRTPPLGRACGVVRHPVGIAFTMAYGHRRRSVVLPRVGQDHRVPVSHKETASCRTPAPGSSRCSALASSARLRLPKTSSCNASSDR